MSSLKNAFASTLMVFASVSVTPSKQAIPAAARPEDQILQLERDWLASDGKGDVASLRRLVADDFMGGSPAGTLLTKEDIIPRGVSGAFAGAVPTDTSVRIFGDTAVLMGFIKTAGSGEMVRVTLVCQKRAETWQMIAAQLAHP
jgi:Domain of unknown function (DUF4440)